ncbi:DASH complex subunit Ask1-domain-containing protein [Halteromyces radiatus]|uniref:DASH complex subunit Ask1-domain-containing protein n=1 Tax=Halteromyces radiatus TaxID=101107 RepID=UPI00221EB623|nr:DASH complex subunit Ask1-domain-containing protein [Halteromyces radiatus]KAI8097672.1 DASH complex subunit Ask1-domain-containing protein [Halteromyces radiatus]
MSISDEDANAELEKLQQNITLTLQSIDHNFARCNQIVSASILPEIEKFAEASREIWNSSKLWLHFIQSSEYGLDDLTEQQHTNRPAFTSNNTKRYKTGNRSSPWERLQRDLHTTLGTSDLSSLGDSGKGMLRPPGPPVPATTSHTTQHDISIARSVHQEIYNSSSSLSSSSSDIGTTSRPLTNMITSTPLAQLQKTPLVTTPANVLTSLLMMNMDDDQVSDSSNSTSNSMTGISRTNNNNNNGNDTNENDDKPMGDKEDDDGDTDMAYEFSPVVEYT